jgi:hypothetical protein
MSEQQVIARDASPVEVGIDERNAERGKNKPNIIGEAKSEEKDPILWGGGEKN